MQLDHAPVRDPFEQAYNDYGLIWTAEILLRIR
jgi:hypothetical protein